MKLRTIIENIQYTPEKIDEFVKQAEKELEEVKRVFRALKANIETLSIDEERSNPGRANQLKDKASQGQAYAEKLTTKYRDIVDVYDFLDAPKNVKKLEKLADQFDNYYVDFDQLDSAASAFSEVVEYLDKLFDKGES